MPTTPLRIRTATERDIHSLTALAREVFAQTYGAAIPPETLRSYLHAMITPGRFAAQLRTDPRLLRLAEIDGQIAGYARLDRTAPPGAQPPAPTIELAQLYLSDRHQGHGIGAALLADACHAARTEGASSIWLCVWRENQRALRFYQRHGFQPIDQMEIFVYDVVFHDLVMMRTLDRL